MNQVREVSSLEQMIQQQIVQRGITEPGVLAAMRRVPRERFLPPDDRDAAYADGAAPIGHGQTISQPYIVALMTQRLNVAATHRVLEIGTGSGYQTAVLAQLAAEVYTVERLKPLLDEAWERLMDLRIRNVRYRYGDGMLGWPEAAPFDRVIITAAAPNMPGKLLLSQLADGGTAVLPIGPAEEQLLVEVTRHCQELVSADICPCRFVKLVGQDAWEAQ
jgi:protein-L-isoaspartate(D-aspartate) O-methyltransferase